LTGDIISQNQKANHRIWLSIPVNKYPSSQKRQMMIPMNKKNIYIAGAIVFILTAWFSEGYNHPDEYFQILEYAGLKLGQTDPANLAWEYHFKMRSAIQPLIAFSIHKCCNSAGINDPFIITFVLRLLTAAISFLSIFMLCRLYIQTINNKRLVGPFLLLSFLLWFSVYNSVRFASDTLSGRIFIIGFAWYFLRKDEDIIKYLIAGLFLGLSFLIRFQTVFMIGGFLAWLLFIKKSGIPRLLILSLGFIMIIGLGVLSDRWLYGSWEITAWNYFQQNIIFDKVSGFGVYPWWYYFEQTFLNSVPPFSLIYIFAVLLYFIYRPKDVITWTLVPFLLIHFIIGHKELRFLYPMLGFLPVMIILVCDQLLQRRGEKLAQNRFVKIFIKTFWITCFVLLPFVIFHPADDRMHIFKKLYRINSGPVLLYYDDLDPYKCCYDVNYYRRSGLVTRKIDSISHIKIPKDTLTYFITAKLPDFQGADYSHSLIYFALPEWMKWFDINNWIERTKFWRIYRIQSGYENIKEGKK